MKKIPDFRRFIVGVFPILQWSRTYTLDVGLGDLIAGITIALTLIPQSIAYASLAGFEPQYGLYASFMGGFVYALMGTAPQVNIGPSALLSLLTFTYTNGTNPDFAVLLCFMSGIIQLVAGIAQLGFLVEFVSLPVVSGFTSAAAITIASSQIKGLLGLKYSADTFIEAWKGLFNHITETRLADSLLSAACCCTLLGMQALKDVPIKTPDDKKGQRNAAIKKKILWFTGVSRNAVVVVVATLIAWIMYNDPNDPFLLTGEITPGLPRPQPPAFETTVGYTYYSAREMLSYLGTGLMVVPVVAILGNVAIAKAFAKGKTLDATQEIVALGVCNIVSSFFRSMPVNGSFSRSAVSEASGVRTPGAGFYTGVIVILTLWLLTPYFYFIPRSALASVITCAVLGMVNIDILKRLWHTSRLDLIPLVGCFVCCLFLGIEVGLLCGVAIDAALLLYYHSRPPLDVQYVNDGSLPPHYAIHPVGRLNFAGAERVRSKLLALKLNKATETLCTNPGSIPNAPETDANIPRIEVNGSVTRNDVEASGMRASDLLVVYCDSLYRLDYTFLQSLKMLVIDWSRSGRVIWCNTRPKVKEQLNSVVHDPIFCDKEQLKAYLTSVIVILTLWLLTPYFYFIPRSALASVITCAVLGMVNIDILKRLWHTSRLDLIPLVGCFVCCLFLGIEVGLLCGVAIDAALLLYYHSRPPLDVQYVNDGSLPSHYAIHPVGRLNFAGAERVRSKLLALKLNKATETLSTNPGPITNAPETDANIPRIEVNGTVTRNDVEASGMRTSDLLVVYCDSLYRLDYTFLQSLKMLVIDWSRSSRVIWCNTRPKVKEQLSSVIHDPIFCDKEQLKAYLTSTDEQRGNNVTTL